MEAEDEESDSPGAFTNKKPWKRIIVLAAGAAMNIIMGFYYCNNYSYKFSGFNRRNNLNDY